MNRPVFPIWLLLAALAVFAVSGCGDTGRNEVTGTVTYKGQPLDEGLITFIPQDGQGTQDGAGISNGAYRIPRDKGLVPGRYMVTIYGGDGVPRVGDGEPSGPAPPGTTPGKERIPAEYNTKSNQFVEITKSGPNKFDFNIP